LKQLRWLEFQAYDWTVDEMQLLNQLTQLEVLGLLGNEVDSSWCNLVYAGLAMLLCPANRNQSSMFATYARVAHIWS
jgi:hypothetical protein